MEKDENNQLSDEDQWLKFYSKSISDLADFGEELYRVFFEMIDFNPVNILSGVNYFKNFVEIIDSISVNISKSIATAPTRILIRAATEYFFSLMYLFENKNSVEQKSLTISYCSIIEDMRGYEPFFPENIKETEKKLKSENVKYQKIDLGDLDYGAKAKYFKDLLGHPDFKEIKLEYLATSKSPRFKAKKYIPWYSLWDGPTNVKALASKTGTINIYESIYNEFSHYTHGSKSFQKDFIHQDGNGSLRMYQKRTPYNLKFVSDPSRILCAILFLRFIKIIGNNDQILYSKLNEIRLQFERINPKDEPIDIDKGLVLKFPSING